MFGCITNGLVGDGVRDCLGSGWYLRGTLRSRRCGCATICSSIASEGAYWKGI